MMNEDNNIDKLFRDKFKDYSEDPPAFVWDGIKEKLDDGRRKIFLAWYKWSAVAALLALAFIAGWYYNESSENVVPQVAEKETIQSLREETLATDDVPQNPIFEIESKDDEDQNAEFLAEAVKIESAKKKDDAVDELSQIPETAVVVSREKLTPPDKINPVEASLFAENRTNTEGIFLTPVKTTNLSQSEREILERNADAYVESSKNETEWRMGVNVSPGYSSHSAKYGNTYASNMTQTDNEGNSNMSGGIAIRYRTASRWSVESGIYYAQNGQQAGSSPQFLGAKAEADYSAAPERLYFNTAVTMESSRIAMNSTAGVIDIENLPAGAEIAANLENFAYSDNSFITQGEISQVFDLIEIPLYLRYLMIESKLDVELIGGISAGVVIGNSAFIDNQFGVQKIGKTRDITTMNVSGTVGLGFSYALNKQFSLALEPRFNYYMNSISSNPEVDFRPYRIGIYTGLYYSF